MGATTTATPSAHLLKGAQGAWYVKEEGAKENPDYDITPSVMFFRDGDPVAMFVAGRVNRDDAIALVVIGASLLDADEVVASMDTHISHEQINPKTGKPWQSGEMQALCNDEGACETGVITDAIFTIRLGQDIPVETISRKYHVNHATGSVHWVDPYDTIVETPDSRMDGVVIDAFRSAWGADAMPSIPMIEPPPGMSTEEARVHRNIAALRVLGLTVGGVMLPLEHLDAHEAVYREYLTPEYMQQDSQGIPGVIATMLRSKFNLDAAT